MRNLKKVLSLTLALVMLLGMMVVGAGAVETNFPDNDKIGDVYKEAVLVMNALNIFQGDNQGKINPKNTLTRAEAAKIMTIVMLGEGGAKGFANVTESTYFTDMKDSSVSWACGYVDYCASVGIIKGNTATTVNPKGTLRAVDFATMLLRAAGVDEADTLEGPNYEVRTIAAAGKYNISDVTRADITREAAAKMALEAIQVSPSGENTFIVTTADGVEHTFTSASEAYFFSKANSDAPVTMTTAKDSLAAKLKLDSHAGTDAFGRTTKVWTVDGKDKVTIESGSAVLTFTTEKGDLSKELKGYKFDKLLKANVLTNGATEGGVPADSKDKSTAYDTVAEIAGATGNGKLVEVYADSSKNVTKIVIVEYEVGTLGVATSKTKTTYTVADVSGADFVDEDKTDTVVFHGAAEKDDVVTAAMVGTTLHIYPTTVVTGTLSALSTAAKTITVAGEKYTVGTAVNDGEGPVAMADFDTYLGKDDVNVYIDVNGVAVLAETETTAPTEYCYVVSAGGSVETSVDGATPKIEARVVLTDGTVGVYKLAVKTDDNNTPNNAADDTKKVADVTVLEKTAGEWNGTLKSGWNGVGAGKLAERAYLYSLDEDNVMTLKAIDAMSTIANNKTVVGNLSAYDAGTKATVETKTVLFNESTKFVVYDAASKTASVVEGRTALGTSGTSLTGKVIVAGSSTANTGVAKLAFVTGAVGSADSGSYVYVDTGKFHEEMVNKVKTRFYTGIGPDGSEVPVTKAASENLGSGTAKGLYKYNTENVITAAFTGENVKTGTAHVLGGMVQVTSGDYYPVIDGVEPVYIAEDGTKVDGNEVIVVLKSGKIEAIYVTDASAEADEGGTPEGPTTVVNASNWKVNITTNTDVKVLAYTGETKKADRDSAIAAVKAELEKANNTVTKIDEDATKVEFTVTTSGGVNRKYTWTYSTAANWKQDGIKVKVLNDTNAVEQLVAGDATVAVLGTTTEVAKYAKATKAGQSDAWKEPTDTLGDGWTYDIGYVKVTTDGDSSHAEYVKAGVEYTAEKPSADKKGTGFKVGNGTSAEDYYLVYGGKFTPAADKDYTLTSQFLKVTWNLPENVAVDTSKTDNTAYIEATTGQTLKLTVTVTDPVPADANTVTGTVVSGSNNVSSALTLASKVISGASFDAASLTNDIVVTITKLEKK